jgi:high-affinity iron transporter
MVQTFVIALREGLEAFLIVAISLAYLRKSGRQALVPAIHWGIGAAIALSIAASWLFQRATNQALWEGVLALVAATLVLSLLVYMWRHARQLKGRNERRLASAALWAGPRAFAGVFFFTLLMITREGMETTLLMGTLLFQIRVVPFIVGAVAGIAGAGLLAWLWSTYSYRVSPALFLQVTAIFLGVFVVQLSIYGFHELTEANLLPRSDELHLATEPYGRDGRYGQYFSYALVLLPMAWLALAGLFGSRTSAVAHPTAAR